MANWIPKIEYVEVTTGTAKTITFSSPPEDDPLNEEIKGNFKQKRSSAGVQQTQFNYNTQTFKIKFLFQSSAVKALVDTFMTGHAFRGGDFKYYQSSDEIDFETFTITGRSFKPARIIPNGSGDFEYNFELTFDRVL